VIPTKKLWKELAPTDVPGILAWLGTAAWLTGCLALAHYLEKFW
jgi:hypothetical protein